ncbi:hypothetical protein CR513_32342, partial [Mucuna pruriens]
MGTEVQFWVKQVNSIQAKAPDVQSLGYKGSFLKGQWRRSTTLEALFQYYDSPVRCFTFKDFQIAFTLEEYERLLRLPLVESPHYFHQAQPPS